MTIARGVGKKIAFKKETAWGELAGAASAKYLRRVTSAFNLTKETYESNEIRTDYQVADMRHGVRSAEGSLNGEFSPGSYTDFIQGVLARDFTAGGTATGLTVTIAASGNLFTIARTAGSWITDGFFVGNVIRLTGASLNVANQDNNLLIVAITALQITVRVLSGTTLVPQASIASVGATAVGKQTFAPLTGHTDDSFTIEEFFSDIAQSEVYTGMKVGSMAMQLPATGLVTCDFSFMGKNLQQTGTTQYFTTPTNASANGIFAAVNGAVVVNGVPVSVITSADITIERGLEPAQTIGTNFAADVFTGRIRVNGNFSTYFENAAFRTYFDQEQTVSLVIALTTDNAKNAGVVSLVLPKVKIGSATKEDGEMGIISQHSFTALLNDTSASASGLPLTTVLVQDTTI